MGILTSLKKKKKPTCAWCGREADSLPYTKSYNNEKYRFCSQSCKKAFRARQKNKSKNACPTCMLTGR